MWVYAYGRPSTRHVEAQGAVPQYVPPAVVALPHYTEAKIFPGYMDGEMVVHDETGRTARAHDDAG
jgi:hypothetical protein